MLLISSPTELRAEIRELRRADKTVSLVPTMGFIHSGHLEVVKVAQQNSDVVIVSIYVNPTQFNDKSDFERYPRNTERDQGLLQEVGVDIVYLPSSDDIYPEGEGNSTTVLVNPKLTKNLCGATRKGHFEGVLLVVSKLLNQIQPDVVVFGLKDYQQYIILKQLANELLYPTSVLACPIIREESGLAMSSRNTRLTEAGKKRAAFLYRGLTLFKTRHHYLFPKNPLYKGMPTEELQAVKARYLQMTGEVQTFILEKTGGTIDYVEIWDANGLDQISGETEYIVCALAVFIEGVRLIDNMVIDLSEEVPSDISNLDYMRA